MPDKRGKICAVVAEQSVQAASAAIERAPRAGADIIEVRLDYLRDFDFRGPDGLAPMLANRNLPVIITCRAIEEGGVQRIDDRVRIPLLVEGARRFANYFDIEASHYAEAAALSPDPSRIIVSHHDFSGIPADIGAIYDRIRRFPAHVYKIAVNADSIEETMAVFRLIDRAQQDGNNLIALAMGPCGVITRIIGPARGAWLSYATLDGAMGSAPGQFDCGQLKRSFRLNGLSKDTLIAGVIGNPVGHSVSPEMHNAAMAAEGLDCVYVPLEVTDLAAFFRKFIDPRSREVDWPLLGFSITIPHKLGVLPLLDELDAVAMQAGAVNTVVIRGGRLLGYNTDVQGSLEPLERVCALKDEKVAVIGSGGSARALTYGLARKRIEATIFARNPDKARPLGDAFGVRVAALDTLSGSDATVLINTTPVGMSGHSNASPVDAKALRGRHIAYDLVYNPLETCFLRQARAAGCRTISGIEMLVSQASLQFELWTGKAAPAALMRAAALARLNNLTPIPSTQS